MISVTRINVIVTFSAGPTIVDMSVIDAWSTSTPNGFTPEEAVQAMADAQRQAEEKHPNMDGIVAHCTPVIEKMNTVEAVMMLTEEAHSREHYGETAWRSSIEFLNDCYGTDINTTQKLMMSKLPRHAADQHEWDDGTVPHWALIAYVESNGGEKFLREYL